MRILVTGGAGFIGSAVCRHLVANGAQCVVNVDKLTYAGRLSSLRSVENEQNYRFAALDIADAAAIGDLLAKERINAVMNLAAESHVDRSIDNPSEFINTNVVGTFRLLSAVLTYWETLKGTEKDQFRFHHVSTDEVYGDLPFDTSAFTETTPYKPSSPYSASKAASDHLVRAWHATYGLPVIITNCSNNYGPYHFPEKLIPLVLLNALEEKPLPVYGTGRNVRDWLYVEDHAQALEKVLTSARVGETYNIGGRAERTNLEVVEDACDMLDTLRPRNNGKSYRELITFVPDRPGHDRRYAIDPQKIETELGWKPKETWASGLAKTAQWYLDNEWWWRPIREQAYDGHRLGAGKKG